MRTKCLVLLLMLSVAVWAQSAPPAQPGAGSKTACPCCDKATSAGHDCADCCKDGKCSADAKCSHDAKMCAHKAGEKGSCCADGKCGSTAKEGQHACCGGSCSHEHASPGGH